MISRGRNIVVLESKNWCTQPQYRMCKKLGKIKLISFFFFFISFSAKNVLLTDEYTRAKLGDFDSARRLPDEFTQAGLKPLGTRGFVSPEVFELLLKFM